MVSETKTKRYQYHRIIIVSLAGSAGNWEKIGIPAWRYLVLVDSNGTWYLLRYIRT